MADARQFFSVIVFAAAGWLTMAAACERRGTAPTAEPAAPSRPATTASDSPPPAGQPRNSMLPDGLRDFEDSGGHSVIKTRGLLRNVTVTRRAADGGVVIERVSRP